MAPGVLVPEQSQPQQFVTFHAAKGKLSRPVLSGADLKPTFDRIPEVDFTLATSPLLEERKQVALAVKDAFQNVGFLYAVNHGISEELQERVYRVTKEFFALPKEEKMKIHINKSNSIKGYEALLETKLDDTSRGDMKEAFNMADDPNDPEQNPPADLDLSVYPQPPLNQWPERPEGFRSTLYEYNRAALGFSKTLLHLIALALDLEETYFDHMLSFPMAGLRPLHYPSQEIASDVGIGAHADYSWFTLVNQLSPTPALEVLNANGHWISAPPIPNSLVVNVGDFLERATNDVFVSTVHRVVNKTGEERYSLPYFFSPSYHSMIEILPTCVSTDRPKKYDDVLAGEWQRERLLRARYKHPASIAARARGEI